MFELSRVDFGWHYPPGTPGPKATDVVLQCEECGDEFEGQLVEDLGITINEIISILGTIGDVGHQKLQGIQIKLKEIRNHVLGILGEEGEDLSGISHDKNIDRVNTSMDGDADDGDERLDEGSVEFFG